MEFGPYTLQVFTSLILILGAAGVALICDFLKGNNEKLRELTIELKVRREEEQKRVELMMPHILAARQAARMPEEDPESEAAEGGEDMADYEQESGSMVTPKDPAAYEEAPLTQPAFTVHALSSPNQPRLVEGQSEAGIEPQRIPEHVLVEAMSAVVESRPAGSRQKTSRKDWGSLLDRKRGGAPAAESPLLTAVLEATATDRAKTGSTALPAGFQEGPVLAELIAKKRPVNGLVMSIGVNVSRLSTVTPPEHVHNLIESLLGPSDFAAETTPGEFLLIFPNERGAAAQRRLSQVAQRLWDFQLHSLETQSAVMFSWGGLEVRDEPVQEAIASANERMQETRRGRTKPRMETAFNQVL